MPWLINATQLDKFRRSQKNIIILDASLHLDKRDPQQEFAEKHIIDAQFFDIDFFSDPHTPLPHQLIQDATLVGEKCGQLGLRNDYKIIFYDNSDLHSACRALWMFKMFGHNPNQLYILDGGLKAWEKFGGKMASGNSPITPRIYQAAYQARWLSTLLQMKSHVMNTTTQIVDMRHPARFAGAPETRPNLRPGHMPGAICFPYSAFFEKEGTFLPLEKIRKKLSDVSIDPSVPIVTTCGSAITAPIFNFILDILGHENHSVYDGSWSEWGANTLYPDEANLAERPVETCLNE